MKIGDMGEEPSGNSNFWYNKNKTGKRKYLFGEGVARNGRKSKGCCGRIREKVKSLCRRGKKEVVICDANLDLRESPCESMDKHQFYRNMWKKAVRKVMLFNRAIRPLAPLYTQNRQAQNILSSPTLPCVAFYYF